MLYPVGVYSVRCREEVGVVYCQWSVKKLETENCIFNVWRGGRRGGETREGGGGGETREGGEREEGGGKGEESGNGWEE